MCYYHQGPEKKYPAVTFERFMVEKSKGFAYTLPKDPKVTLRATTPWPPPAACCA